MFKFTRFSGEDLYDTHCHFNDSAFNTSRAQCINDALQNNVRKIVDVSIDLNTFQIALQNAKEFPDIVYPTIGIHPELCVPGSDLYDPYLNLQVLDQKMAVMSEAVHKYRKEILMIGECGMDLYWLQKNGVDKVVFEKSRELQRQLFFEQVKLAVEYELPLTIHSRNALNDCLGVLSEFNTNARGVFHSFTGTYAEAKLILDKGFGIGINGIVTYKSASDVREVLRKIIGSSIAVPKDLYEKGVFLETDAPYLKPRTSKATINTPSEIKTIFEFVQSL